MRCGLVSAQAQLQALATPTKRKTTTMNNSRTKAKRPVRFSDDGFTAFITLATGEVAMIDREDHDRFVQEGISLNWYRTYDRHRNGPYVQVWHKPVRNIMTVSRLVMRAGKGEVVSFRNGDLLDLRKSNLRIDGGPAWRQTERTPVPSIYGPEQEEGNVHA